MKHDYSFAFGRVRLLPLTEDDIESLRIARNKERFNFNNNNLIDASSQKRWFESYLNSDNDIMFKIVHRDKPDTFIGAIAVYNIDYEKGIGEIGRTVIDKDVNSESGLGLDATKAVCLFSFVVLGLKKVYGSQLKTNSRMLKVNSRAGYYIIGETEDSFIVEMTLNTINL